MINLRPNAMSLADSLDALVSVGGSDLLVSCGSPPRVRKDGTIVTVPGAAPVDAELIGPMLRSLLGEQRWETLQRDRSVDFSFTWQSHVRMRGNAFFQRGTLAAAFRLLPLEIPGFEQLGVPGIVPALLERSQGLMLVTGPTGSGKSTTQAAMIEHLNRSRGCHIITVEDPIEYVHRHQHSLVEQRQVGRAIPDQRGKDESDSQRAPDQPARWLTNSGAISHSTARGRSGDRERSPGPLLVPTRDRRPSLTRERC